MRALLRTAPLALALASGAANAAPAAASIPFEKIELANGLDVILSPDSSVPFVWVEIWYDVGSKDEKPGRTGFAHLFEHLMFQGSAHQNTDYFVPLQAIGASINGTTNLDRTNYYEGVPSEQLPLALWLESDRMGWLLPVLDDAKLQNQKDVVRNERRQNYDNRPYGRVPIWLQAALYPPEHPYHTPTIGKHEDIEAASLADVSEFFRTWYLPNNATLAIVGDYDKATALELVQRYFGDLPAGTPGAHNSPPPPTLTEQKIIRKTDDAPLSKVWIAWVSPPVLQPGDAELDILSAVLAEGKDSRLYRRLVQEKGVAQDVSVYQQSGRISSQFVINATARPGHSTDALVAEIDAALAELQKKPVSAEELSLAVTDYTVAFYGAVSTLAGKARSLCSYNNTTGDPGYMAKDLARYQALTPEAVTQAAARLLPADKRVVLHVTPGPKEN